jgi:hypothetical protein
VFHLILVLARDFGPDCPKFAALSVRVYAYNELIEDILLICGKNGGKYFALSFFSIPSSGVF